LPTVTTDAYIPTMSASEPGHARGSTFAATYRESRPESSVGFARQVRQAARHVALTAAGAALPPSQTPVLRSLFLHSVYDDQIADFRRLLERLMAMGPFLSTQEVLEVASGRRTLEARSFHLSFDDGFDNHYRNAFPILQDMGIRAAFFVPSAFIGATDSDVMDRWWTKIDGGKPTRPMRWEWLREMSAAGHEIGSHTKHHIRLSDVSSNPARLAEEVTGSKLQIEDELGRECRSIAWPFGTARDFDERSRAAVEEAGYSLCFSAMRGHVDRPPLIPRHHFEANWPWLHVRYVAAGGGEKRR
jgi:peptidoglycan/xylan/chitin deacetylase (PgdA/CDA1 family)